jgi:hypothetical protein
MKYFHTFLVLILFISVTINAQDNVRKPSLFPGSTNNPEVVFGPELNTRGTLAESFESTTFPPAGWVKITPTGGAGWNRQLYGTTPVPGFNGGTIIPPPVSGAGTAAGFANYATGGSTSCDQWLITPQIMNVQPNDSLSFWLWKFGNYVDQFQVKISTTTPNVAGMTVTVAILPYAAADSGWTKYSYNIGSLVPAGSNIYVGFREYVANSSIDGASFVMDLVTVTEHVVPVELSSFTAAGKDGYVSLAWSTATETNNQGFVVERSSIGEFTEVGFVKGHGTTTSAQQYSFVDNVAPGNYSYRLKQVDFDGTFEYSDAVEVEITAPVEFSLSQNYPNPFNPSTTINFALAADSKVKISVFNGIGQQVATIVNNSMGAGAHTVNFNASELNSGVYFYRIEASGVDGTNFSSVKKMILTK